MSFSGKHVWIIGASAGIGEALARALSRQGAHLILSARNEHALQTLARDCPVARVIALDVAEHASLARAIEQLGDARLDAVICTAAVYDPGRVADLDPDKTETLIRVNLLGSLNVAQLMPSVLKPGGQLVLFGSVAGYFGLPKGQAYSATKAGVNNLAETLRTELAPNVDVRLVCPGFVETRLTAKNEFRMPGLMTAEDAADRIIEGLQGKRFEIHFPKRLTWTLKILQLLPYALSMRLVARLR